MSAIAGGARHSTLRGAILYTSDKPERRGKERGREYFSITRQSDGVRVVHSHCEIDDAPDVLRDVVLSLDPAGRPLDAFVRLSVGGRFEGSGWMRFSESQAECESFNRQSGRTTQRIALPRPLRGLVAHPLVGDALCLQLYDRSAGPGRAFYPDVMLTSPDHRGATGPLLFQAGFGLEFVGEESIEVTAGRFDALHFRYVDTDELPVEHPPYDIWCSKDAYIFLRGAVGGYMQTRYELISLQRGGG